ncbi:MAG: hypothetical protein ACAH88_07580, partial [Roseimicrobium sp.]
MKNLLKIDMGMAETVNQFELIDPPEVVALLAFCSVVTQESLHVPHTPLCLLQVDVFRILIRHGKIYYCPYVCAT